MTLHGYFNYGNRLQNYALIKVLEGLGNEVDTLIIKKNNDSSRFFSRISKIRSISDILKIIKKVFLVLSEAIFYFGFKSKEKKLKKFSINYLNEKFIDYRQLRDQVAFYDYFIVGSDQVWNENSYHDFHFLDFSLKEKNIAYAASIGNDEVSNQYKEHLSQKLMNFKAISVREFYASETIQSVINFSPEVVLDPTLLLTMDDWNSIAIQSRVILNVPYLLTYYLGKAPQKQIKKIAREKNLQIKNLSNPKDSKYLASSVEDFLFLFANASYVMTDSYHGTIFSLLFERNFMTYRREDMNSRLITLFSLFELNKDLNGHHYVYESIDYSIFKKKLEILKISSKKFISDALIK